MVCRRRLAIFYDIDDCGTLYNNGSEGEPIKLRLIQTMTQLHCKIIDGEIEVLESRSLPIIKTFNLSDYTNLCSKSEPTLFNHEGMCEHHRHVRLDDLIRGEDKSDEAFVLKMMENFNSTRERDDII